MTPLDKLNAIEEALKAIEYLCLPETLDAVKNSAGRIAQETLALIPQLRQEIERLTAENQEMANLLNMEGETPLLDCIDKLTKFIEGRR